MLARTSPLERRRCRSRFRANPIGAEYGRHEFDDDVEEWAGDSPCCCCYIINFLVRSAPIGVVVTSLKDMDDCTEPAIEAVLLPP